MWRQYRKALVPMQLLILAACAAMRFIALLSWGKLAILFLLLEAGALIWAGWMANRQRQHRRRRGMLPLERRMKN